MNLLAGRPRLVDAALAGAATAFAVVAVVFDIGEGDSGPDAVSFVLVALAGTALLFRRREPVAVLAVVVAARLLMAWDSGNDVALVPAAMIALYTVARTGDRRRALVTSLAAAALMMVVVAAVNSDEFAQELVGEVALMLLPIAVADAARSRADRVHDLIETEATARVQAERLRIARDLHDVVAHGLSTIAIQSGVAAHLIERDPDHAKDALEVINATGKRSLEELRAMVGVLRSTDDAPLRPTPSDPDDLSDVFAGAAHAGLDLTIDVRGGFPSDVADASVVAVHRIIQEALTNVARHAGPVPVVLSLHHGSEQLRLQIANEPGGASVPSTPSTGVGVVGMTERAESLGGSLRAESTDAGGFVVDAVIPYRQRVPIEDRS